MYILINIDIYEYMQYLHYSAEVDFLKLPKKL